MKINTYDSEICFGFEENSKLDVVDVQILERRNTKIIVQSILEISIPDTAAKTE
jgi:hypothetical protein